MELLLGESLAIFRRVASGDPDLKKLSAATFVDGLDVHSQRGLN